MLKTYKLLMERKLKKSLIVFVAIFSLLILVVPVISEAVTITRRIIEVDCVAEPDSAQWITTFEGELNTKAILVTKDISFSKGRWKTFIKDPTLFRYRKICFGATPRSEGSGILFGKEFGGDEEAEIESIKRVFINGKDPLIDDLYEFNREGEAVLAESSNVEIPVKVVARCVGDRSLPVFQKSELHSEPHLGLTFSSIEKSAGNSPGVNPILNFSGDPALLYNMWPKDTVLPCAKGNGIAVKFESPNGNYRDIVYHAALFLVRDTDEKQQTTQDNVTEKLTKTQPYLLPTQAQPQPVSEGTCVVS